MNDPNNMIMDKSMRSVFVGNIPYEATEEKLKDIFSEVGAVASFKLVYDRETGKPKGYGFCEYKDQETALSAMRNLNGFEIAGRTLRVDNACTEKSRMEMQSLMAEPVAESPFGPPCEPGRAPETISKAVASLPPEQMFQLMQQMKVCIQNNPQEARTMLLQNPQLAYALLQAQVVMRIVDPETAVTMLHKTQPNVQPVGLHQMNRPPMLPTAQPNFGAPFPGGFQQGMPKMEVNGPRLDMHVSNVMDLAGLQRPNLDYPGQGPRPGMDMGMPRMNMDQNRAPPPFSSNNMERDDGRAPPRDPRSRDPRDRGGSAGPVPRGPPNSNMGGGPRPAQLPPHLAGADPEKAQLIMQVLQLTDEQIAVLPAEQRQSIMVLKEQIKQGPIR